MTAKPVLVIETEFGGPGIVVLRVPLAEAMASNIDALNDRFVRAAEKAGGSLLDDSESEGGYVVFEFTHLTAEQVGDLAARVLPKKNDKGILVSGVTVVVETDSGP